MTAYSIVELLTRAFEEKASDLHLTKGIPPVYRIHGQLEHYGTIPLEFFLSIDNRNLRIREKRTLTFHCLGNVDSVSMHTISEMK